MRTTARKTLLCEQLEARQLMASDLTSAATPALSPQLPQPPAIPLPTVPRSFDGTGNNVRHSDWGSTSEQFLRSGTPEYGNGISSLAGSNRKSAREISNLVIAQPDSDLNARGLSDIAWQWGQFIDHDLDLTLSATPAESAPIAVPSGDTYFDPQGTGTATIGLSRSIYDTTTGTDPTNPRQQVNSITAWIDGSMIYGSDSTTAASLRTFSGGKLKTSEGNLLPRDADGNFLAGDIRVNEQVGLISMQTLFMREHNRVAEEISRANPRLNDEQLYQKARAFVIGEVQAITYNEFLPAMLGRNGIRPYAGYRPNVNPTVTNEFATAAFRYGHSMLSPQLLRLNNDGTTIAQGNISLRNAFFQPNSVVETGIDPLLKGLATQQAQELDNHVIDEVRNFLFGQPGQGGFDLASLNIQRGRDHGLPDFNQARQNIGLPRITSFAQISRDTAVQNALQQAYGTVDNIDVWVGALAEDHVRGSSMGRFVWNTVADQFTRLRDGDNYWYQRTFSGETLRRLENTHLADVIRRNTTITQLQPNVFFAIAPPVHQPQPPGSGGPTQPPGGPGPGNGFNPGGPISRPQVPNQRPEQPHTPQQNNHAALDAVFSQLEQNSKRKLSNLESL